MPRVTVLAVLAVALLLAACTSQELDVTTREQVPESLAQQAEQAASGEGDGGGGEPVEATLELTAVEFAFEGVPDSTSAGNVEFVLSNEGQVRHNLFVEEMGDLEVVADVSGGEQASGTAQLESGTLTLYCDVPGHRAQGMEATIEVQ